MKLEDMSNMDLSYIEGFVEKCAAHNVDPELFLESLLSKKAQAGDGETQKPNPGGSDKGEEKKEESKPSKKPAVKPDYEKRRKAVNVGVGATGGALAGGLAGALAPGMLATDKKRMGSALIGAGAGAGLGAGAGMLYNTIRNALGFSAMGKPVTEQKF